MKLFNETALYNLTLGEEIKECKIKKVCKEVGILDLIESWPNKFNTVINDNKMKLSGGQIQKFLIGRVLLKDSSIIIFDEATSAIDLNSENDVVNFLSKIKIGKTIIFITHKEYPISISDKVFSIEYGKEMLIPFM